MWNKFLDLICPKVETPSPVTLATLTTPEEIIAAHFIESIRKDVDQWEALDFYSENTPLSHEQRNDYRKTAAQPIDAVLRHKTSTKKLAMVFYESKALHYGKNFYINGLPIPVDHGQRILSTYHDQKSVVEEAKRVAAEALLNMQRNEQAWNMVEDLVGLVRDKNGALMPKPPKERKPPTPKLRPASKVKL